MTQHRKQPVKKRRGRLPLLGLLAILVVCAGFFAIRAVDASTADVLPVPYLSQENTMPTGCELVSATMVLQYYGYDITADDFVDNYVDTTPITYTDDGTMIAPDPNDAFVGNPREYASYGCYAPVVAKAMNRVTSGSHQAQVMTGTPLSTLAELYVANGTPVLVWVTIDMTASCPGDSWLVADTGDWFTWIAGEHCMMLVGSEEDCYYLLDPHNSNGLVSYDKALVESRFQELGYQSVVLE